MQLNHSQQLQIDSLEQENKNLQQRFKRERDTMLLELEDKKGLILRYSSEVKEVTSQKTSLKSALDEYEQKIKSLINELEQQSKRHMKEIKQLHEQYMGFKSQAAELKTRMQLCQVDQDQAVKDARDAKKENVRLTFQNDELETRIFALEKRMQAVVKRTGATHEDLEAVDKMLLSQQ